MQCLFCFVGLLSNLFNLYDMDDGVVAKLEVLQSIGLLIQKSTEYTYLMSELYNHRIKLIRIIENGGHQLRTQKQLMLIIYHFISNVSPFFISPLKARIQCDYIHDYNSSVRRFVCPFLFLYRFAWYSRSWP